SFFGRGAGYGNTIGSYNSFLWRDTGQSNTTGSRNTLLGAGSDVASANLSFATAVGAGAVVGANDTIVIGKVAGTYDTVSRPADTVQIPGTLSVTGNLTANGSNLTNINASNI